MSLFDNFILSPSSSFIKTNRHYKYGKASTDSLPSLNNPYLSAFKKEPPIYQIALIRPTDNTSNHEKINKYIFEKFS